MARMLIGDAFSALLTPAVYFACYCVGKVYLEERKPLICRPAPLICWLGRSAYSAVRLLCRLGRVDVYLPSDEGSRGYVKNLGRAFSP
jgi:hypothetical protein